MLSPTTSDYKWSRVPCRGSARTRATFFRPLSSSRTSLALPGGSPTGVHTPLLRIYNTCHHHTDVIISTTRMADPPLCFFLSSASAPSSTSTLAGQRRRSYCCLCGLWQNFTIWCNLRISIWCTHAKYYTNTMWVYHSSDKIMSVVHL